MNTKRKLIISLLNKVQAKTLSEAINLMWEHNLLNKRALEQLYIESEVARRVRAGEVKSRAMEQLSVELGCSYEKVRSAVYNKHKN